MNVDFNTLMLLGVAITNAATAYLVYLTKRDVRTVELATNSMKDALVAATAKASLAEGLAQGRNENKDKSNV